MGANGAGRAAGQGGSQSGRQSGSQSGAGGFGIITGGSCGIGLGIARELLGRGQRLLLVGRHRRNFESALLSLPAVLRPRVDFLAADVRDAAALQAGIAAAIAAQGAPAWLVTCAGIAEPGRFLDLPRDSHEVQWQTNYIGTLNTVHACLPAMAAAGGGRIVLVSSAAALGTFHGYSAYAPAKAAVRALGDILALELRPQGIAVTIAFPPDTATAQFAEERRRRPPVAARFLGGNRVFPVARVARDIVRAAEGGRRHVAPGGGTSLLLRFPALLDAWFRWQQARIGARLARQAGG